MLQWKLGDHRVCVGTTLYVASGRGDKWIPYVVIGETSQSWIVENRGKVAKNTLIGRSWGERFHTKEQCDRIDEDAQYASVMRHRLSMLIVVATAAQLREYAAALGVT